MRASKYEASELSPTQDERGVYMWEVVKRAGDIYYVPLNGDLDPVADIALQDIQGRYGGDAPAGGRLVVGAGASGRGSGEAEAAGFGGLAVKAIESILSGGDATTYEIYEALIARLVSSALLDEGYTAGVDVEGILYSNFWCYELPVGRGAVVRKWTLCPARAKAYGQRGSKRDASFAPLPRPLIFAN